MQKIVRRTGAPFVAFLLLVATMLAAPAKTVTSPKQQFGHDIGDDYFLANYTQLPSTGRSWRRVRSHEARFHRQDGRGTRAVMAIISRPRNIKKLDRYKGHRRAGSRTPKASPTSRRTRWRKRARRWSGSTAACTPARCSARSS